ncbi:MAG: ribosome assembly RNA-binding protein YhbY [Halanaerobiales bacterium]
MLNNSIQEVIDILNGKQRSYLRGKANDFDPVIHIGKEGISEQVIDQVKELLADHELIKGRVLDNAPLDAGSAARELADETGASVVQVIGNVFVIFLRNKEEPIYNLP